jgi:ribonuclease Z
LSAAAEQGRSSVPRELIVLGTASQVPTRARNHNGYLLRWDGSVTLFDPGEGTQRQMILAGVPTSAVTCVCVTHFHGDHCLGLPGVLQRMALDGVGRPLPLVFPAGGAGYVERLRHASIFDDRLDVRTLPVQAPADGSPVVVLEDADAATTLFGASLRHTVETVGWRIEEHPARSMVPERLRQAGISGPAVGRLRREGSVVVGDRTVTLDEMSVERPPQVAAFVMDTAWCEGALALAADADLLVCEATFSDEEADRAAAWGHLTAGQAGRLAKEAGARRLVITHFSQRHPDATPLAEQAAAEFGTEVVAASDLLRVPFPPRRSA